MTSVFPAIEVVNMTRGNGIDTRVSVRAASTAPVNLGSNLNGATVGGVSLVTGDRVLVKDQTEVSQIVSATTVADVSGSLNNKYVLLSSTTTDYYVWFNVNGAGVDPAVPGRSPIVVALATNDSANTVATKTQVVLNAHPDFTAPAPVANIILITTDTAGYSLAGAAGNSGFTVSTSQTGSGARDHGIWTVGAGAGASYRADDLLVGDDAAFVFCDCEEGTNAKTSWSQVAKPAIVGTNPLSWVQRSTFNYSVNDIVYATSSSTLGKLTSVPDRMLVTNGSGVPTYSQALPAGTTSSTPVSNNEVANKAYVDSVATGLDVKESVKLRTKLPIGGTYAPTGGTGGTGAFTGVDLTSSANFDLGPALQVGDRVLIMDQADAKQNGIYVVTTAGGSGAIERAPDHNGTPAAEVSGGNFVFVEAGATYASTGWVLQGTGTLTLNTDNLVWVQFSSPGTWNALNGITISGADISTDLFTNGGIVYNGSSPNGQLQVDLSATAIAGTLSPTKGGTGFSSYSVGDLLYADTTTSLAQITSSVRKVLTTDSSGSGVPGWRNTVHLTDIKGITASEPNLIAFTNTDSAINHITISNSLTGVAPIISVASSLPTPDANVSMRVASKGTGAIEIVGDTNSGEVRLYNQAKTFYAGIKAAAMASNITWTWPATDGANGNVMQTNGSGVLSFVNLTASARQIIPLVTIQATASTTTLTAVGYFNWDQTELAGVGSGKIFYNADVTGTGKTLEVQVWNETLGAQLGLDTQTASGFYKFAFTLPTANARLSIRIRKTPGGGASPSIFGVSLILNPST